jgi:hypothetical protein
MSGAIVPKQGLVAHFAPEARTLVEAIHVLLQ